MHEHNRCKWYSCLRNMINENEINSFLHLINRIQEHRCDKIKARQIDTFEHLYFKKYGFHHNLTRGSENFAITTANVILSRHSHLPGSSSSTRSNASRTCSTPAAPMSPSPSATTPLAPTIHTSILTTPNKSGSSTSPTAPLHQCKNPYWQEAQTLPQFQSTPKESCITVVEEACSKLPPGKQMNWDLISATYLETPTTTTITKPTSP